MAKLCAKGKAAAKRKFEVYPSAYANMYASKVCKGKVRASAKDGGIMEVPGGYAKEGVGRISDKGLKGESPSKKFRNLEKRRENTKKFPTKRRKMKSGGLAIKGRGCEIR